MKKRKVVDNKTGVQIFGLISMCFALTIFGCGGQKASDLRAPSAMLMEYLNGVSTLNVEEAYALYDEDTSKTKFIDVRSFEAYSINHEIGAMHLNELVSANKVEGSRINSSESTFIIYADQFQKALDAWIILYQNGLGNVKVVRGNFDPVVGMLIDISNEPTYAYAEEFELAKKRLATKEAEPPSPLTKKKIITKKKKVVEKEEEGC